MATLTSSQELKPIGDGFGTKRFVGFEIETKRNEKALTEERMQIGEFKRLIDPRDKMVAMVGYDGGDVEVITQPIEIERVPWDPDFNNLLMNINEYCLPVETSGTHIHASILPTDKKAMWKNLYWFSLVFDRQLYAIFRRTSHWARSPKEWWKSEKNQGEKLTLEEVMKRKYPIHGFKGTIIIRRQRTYECRGGSASTSPAEIKAWGQLFANIVEFCNQSNIVGHRFEEVIPSGEAGDIIRQRLNGEQLRQIVPYYIYL